jgi:hypothetical protein
LNNFDAELIKSKKNTELEEINQLMPEVFEAFNLIPKRDDSREEDIKSLEGHHEIPYKSKDPNISISENNSNRSMFSIGGSFHDNISNPCIANKSNESNNEDDPNGAPGKFNTVKAYVSKRQSDDDNLGAKAPDMKDLQKKSLIFELAKFEEIKSPIIDEVKEKYENTPKSKKDGNPLTSFDKKFKLNKGEKLLDSFT